MPAVRPALLLFYGILGCADPEVISVVENSDASNSPVTVEYPSILVVVMDTVRADHTSAYGYERNTTPALGELASTGVRFSDASTPGTWTWPNHASLFTGQPPWVHGATFAPYERSDILADDHSMSLRAMRSDLPTLAGRLGDAGYRTTALSANPILRQSLGLTRGFDTVEIPPAPGDGRAPDDQVVARLSRHLAEVNEQPQFVFVNLFSAHMPYILSPSDWIDDETRALLRSDSIPEWLEPFHHPPPYAGMSGYAWLEENRVRVNDAYATGAISLPSEGLALLTDLYDGNIRLADHYLGQILNLWVSHYPDSIIVVTSDHGEFLGEHRLLDHGRFVFDEVLRVPLVVRAPDLTAGQVVNDPVQIQELMPFVLRLSGVDSETESPLHAAIDQSLASRPIAARAWADPTKALHVGGRFSEGGIAYREGNLLLRLTSSGDSPSLFDVSEDPEQRRNLAEERPDSLEELRRRGMASTEEVDALLELGEPPMDSEDRARLEALGYLE